MITAYPCQYRQYRTLIYQASENKHYLWLQAAIQNRVSVGPGTYRQEAYEIEAGKVIQANSIIIPIPAKASTLRLSSINKFASPASLMWDLEKAALAQSRTITSVIRAVGTDDLVSQDIDPELIRLSLVHQASQINEAMTELYRHRTSVTWVVAPQFSSEVIESLAQWYVGWTFLVLCFDTPTLSRTPIVRIGYDPICPEQLFVPSLVGIGETPQVGSVVRQNQTVMFGTYRLAGDGSQGFAPNYPRDMPSELRSTLPARVVGVQYDGSKENNDVVLKVEDLISMPNLMIRSIRPNQFQC